MSTVLLDDEGAITPKVYSLARPLNCRLLAERADLRDRAVRGRAGQGLSPLRQPNCPQRIKPFRIVHLRCCPIISRSTASSRRTRARVRDDPRDLQQRAFAGTRGHGALLARDEWPACVLAGI